MDILGQSHRSDERLEAILFETGRWAVNGRHGQVLGYAASLEQAVKRSASFNLSGARVIAICRLPLDDIVIFPEQIGRLRRIVRTYQFIIGKPTDPTQNWQTSNVFSIAG